MVFTEREKKGIAYLEKRLAMPRTKFILIHGVLLWGLPMGLIISLFNLAAKEYTYANWIRKDLWVSLGLFMLISGVFFGWWIRRNLQKELKRLKELKDKDALTTVIDKSE